MQFALPVTVSIGRSAAAVYDFAYRPESFARWASGLGGGLVRDGETWIAKGPDGRPVRIRFTPKNDFGVLDHWVTLDDGSVLSIPLRVVANGDGAELTLILFRDPRHDDAAFARDADWVARDLATLKALLEA